MVNQRVATPFSRRRPSQPAIASDHIRPLTRLDGLLAALVGLIGLGCYLRTLYPGLLPGDSGEFQALAYLLSDTHPTGYPVYLLLARLIAFLPLHDVAYRVNLFSALMAAVTLALVFLAGRVVAGNAAAGFFGAGVLAASQSFWSQAVIAEVYTPATAFLTGVIFCMALWHEDRKPVYLFVAGILGGLSLGVHLMVALAAPALGLALLLRRPRWRRMWLPAVGGLAIGLALWLGAFLVVDLNQGYANYFNSSILPARSAWQFTPDALNTPWKRLWFGLSARQFQPYLFANPASVMPQQWQLHIDQLQGEFSRVALALALIGLAALLVAKWRTGVFFLAALIGQLLFTLNYQIWDLYVFLIPTYALLAILAAAGIGAFLNLARRIPGHWSWIVQAALATIFLALALQPFAASRLAWLEDARVTLSYDGYPGNVDPEEFHQEVADLVAALPQESILFTNWGVLYAYYYVAQVEQQRPDLYFIDPLPRDDYPHFSPSTAELIRQSLPSRPVLSERILPEATQAGFSFEPVHMGGQVLYQIRD